MHSLYKNYIEITPDSGRAAKHGRNITLLNKVNRSLQSREKSQQLIEPVSKLTEYLITNNPFIQNYKIPKFATSKTATKPKGVISSFAANSTQGISRINNEERISIVLSMNKDPKRAIDYWPQCYMFGIFDGHNGSGCANYLRDNLHNIIIENEFFPKDPKKALYTSILKAENNFCKESLEEKSDRSGSCALVALFVGISII